MKPGKSIVACSLALAALGFASMAANAQETVECGSHDYK